MIRILQLPILSRARSRFQMSSLAALVRYSTIEKSKSNSFVFVGDGKRRKKWPNSSLGPVDSINPKYPMPGNVGLNGDFRPRIEKSIANNCELYSNPVHSLPFGREDRYLSILTQTFANIELSEHTSGNSTRPLVTDIAENLKGDQLRTHFKIQRCPHLLKFALGKHYPGLSKLDELTAITHLYETQHQNDLYSGDMAEERLVLAEDFIARSIEICGTLREMGYLADFINPHTGKPYLAPHDSFELITDTHPGMEQLLGFEVDQRGCCKLVRHPVWGANFFVGLVFTNAPRSHPVLNQFDQDYDL